MGLLDGVLPYVFSQSDRLKRHVGGLLSDPMGSLQQTAGLLSDQRREMSALDARAFADPRRPFAVTDKQALGGMIDKTMNGPMGFAPVGMMAGVGAKTANKVALAAAEKRLAAGDDPAKVWAETGWGKGPDGKMRFEIDDSKAKFEKSFTDAPPNAINGAVGDVLDHPELYKAYPNMSNTGFGFYPNASNPMYMPAADKVIIPGGRGETGLSNMLHELQHGVQTREKFAAGGNFGGDYAKYQAYMDLPGEVEARLVEDRMRLTAAERRAKYPF